MSIDYNDAPVLRQRGWRHLLRALAAIVPFTRAIKQAELQVKLAPVAALARWIAWQGIEPVAGRLRILVVGAERLDTHDGGIWYALLPALLGSGLRISVTFVGPRLRLQAPRLAGFPAPNAEEFAVVGCSGLLRDCSEGHPVEDHDLAMLFQPGFETNDSWFEGPDLARLVASGIPCGATSYGFDEYLMDRQMLEAHGYSVRPEWDENPFSLPTDDPQVVWAHTLWRLGDQVPEPGQRPDRARIDQVQELGRMLARLYQAGYRQSPLRFGTRVAPPGAGRELAEPIFLMGNAYLDGVSGRVFELHDGKLAPRDVVVAPDDLEHRPRADGNDLSGAWWAMEIVRKYREPGR